MQGGWQPPPGGGGYGPPGGYGPTAGSPTGYGQPPPQYPQNPYGAQPPPQMAMMQPQCGNYEFNDYENSVIDKAAGRAKLWGIISTALGALQIIGSCGMFASPPLASYLPAGIVGVVVGVTFIGLGNSLKAVVATQGNDLMHMMQAMQKMSTAFIIQIICAIVGFVLAAIALVLIMFVFVAVAASR
jgi:hypothetical protein